MENYPLSVAPMIQWTDRLVIEGATNHNAQQITHHPPPTTHHSHWRFFMRQITSRTLLYTEMTMDHALIHNPNNLDPFLGNLNGPPSQEQEQYDPYPLAIQLGGTYPLQY
jgi:tRNA-dihydrouridine synthase